MKKEKKKLKEIVLPNSGNKAWYGGAYTITFVYSKTEGNYILKGYFKEVADYLSRKSHWFANITLWYKGQYRNIWEFWKDDIYICRPERKLHRSSFTKNIERNYKWRVRKYHVANALFKFSRFPNRWIKEFDTL